MGPPRLSGEARHARRAPSTALGVLTCLLGARGPPARIAATARTPAAAGTEYSERDGRATRRETSAAATNAMTTLVMRSPVQNSGGVNAAGQWFLSTLPTARASVRAVPDVAASANTE